MLPSRLVNLDAARKLYGERVERLGKLLLATDPLADAASAALSDFAAADRSALLDRSLEEGCPADAPEAVRALFKQVEHVPFWVDFDRAERGGAAFFRAGPLSSYVLAFQSVMLSYCSPAGNKPLAFSGRFRDFAARRAYETGRFIQLVCLPGGMRKGGPGFRTALRVRLLHTQIRRMLVASPRWRTEDWGVPINQADMAGTLLLFSLVVADGLTKVGAPLTDDEAEDLVHLWRYVGWVMGVEEELLCATTAEARILWKLIDLTTAEADEDSRALAKALIEAEVSEARTPRDEKMAKMRVPLFYGLSRYLIGEERAKQLGFPNSPVRLVMPALRHLMRPATGILRRVPFADRAALEVGKAYWQWLVDTGLDGNEATFEMPQRAAHA
jgi:hypothetical protein